MVFLDMSGPVRTLTADKAEFIGRNGQLAKPAALSRPWRSGAMGASLEPCAAMQRSFDLAAGQSIEINILLGTGRSAREAVDLVKRFRAVGATRQAVKAVYQYWRHTLRLVVRGAADQQ